MYSFPLYIEPAAAATAVARSWQSRTGDGRRQTCDGGRRQSSPLQCTVAN